MAQKSYYQCESFDFMSTALTYSSSNGAGFATAGVMQYTQLPNPANQTLNFYMSVLWGKGSGTAPTALVGLYQANAVTSATKLTLLGVSANIGGSASALLRVALVMGSSTIEVNPAAGPLFGAYLLVTEAGTNKTDIARNGTYATNAGISTVIESDPTGGGQLARNFIGAGTGLSAMPATETLSGVTNDVYEMWMALD